MNESTRQRLAFDQYVRLGAKRSLVSLYETLRGDPSVIGAQCGPALSTLESWSTTFHWQERLSDIEREASRRDHDELIQQVRTMNDRHARAGMGLQQKAVERLTTVKGEDLQPLDAVKALVEGIRIERLARGAATERIHQEGEFIHGHIDLGNFSLEELKRLAEIADRAAAGDIDEGAE